MSASDLTITVAINTYDRPDALLQCLLSLNSQTYQDFTIIVVNGGKGIDANILAQQSQQPIKLIQQKKEGLVEARNLCWRESSSDIVCIIDDDLVLSPQWLEEIQKTFLLSETIGGVTGPTLVREKDNRDAFSLVKKFQKGSLPWRMIGKFYLSYILENKINEVGKIVRSGTFTYGSNFEECTQQAKSFEVDYLEACHMCFRRSLLEQVGGFDYCYTGTSEWSEPDVAFKIKRLGCKLLFNPKAVTEHRMSKEGVFKARSFAYERCINFITFYFKNIKPNTLDKALRFFAYLVYMNLYWCYKAFQTKNIDWLTGIFGTVVGLVKNSL